MIHKALRLIRQYHGKSQSELSKELVISKDKLISIEAGQFPVSSDVLEIYSRIFDIPVSSLVLFSDSIGREGKYTKRVRSLLAGKALKVLEWMVDKNETQKIRA